MGYLHIDNLYKNREILMFQECYVMEKIHGTSTHISYDGDVTFFHGGESVDKFRGLFDPCELKRKFEASGCTDVTVYGEGYGGKQQGMKDVYGEFLKFVAFDVKIGNHWLVVPAADGFVKDLGLDFVWYTKTPTDVELLNKYRDQDSQQAIRNGMGEGKHAEGIVCRPLIEVSKNNGQRIIVKHKRDDFRETLKKRKVERTAEELAVLEKTDEIVEEWVTHMRLTHVMGKIVSPDMRDIPDIIRAMIEDVKRESEGEVVWNKKLSKAIGNRTANMARIRIQNPTL